MIELVNFYFDYLKSLNYTVSRLIPLDDERVGNSFLVLQAVIKDKSTDFCVNTITFSQMSVILVSDTIRSYEKAHKEIKVVQNMLEQLNFPDGNEEMRVYSATKYIVEDLGLDKARRYAIKLSFDVAHNER